MKCPTHTTKTEINKKKSIEIDGAELAHFFRECGLPIPTLGFSIELVKGNRNTLIFSWDERDTKLGLE